MRLGYRVVIAICAAAIGIGTLTACSGSAPAKAPSSSSSAGNFGRAIRNNPQVQACLKAAGITLPTPTGTFPRRTGSNRPRPSFTGPRPTGSFPRRGFGGDPAQLQKIEQTLKACGITLPTRSRSGGAPSPQPTG